MKMSDSQRKTDKHGSRECPALQIFYLKKLTRVSEYFLIIEMIYMMVFAYLMFLSLYFPELFHERFLAGNRYLSSQEIKTLQNLLEVRFAPTLKHFINNKQAESKKVNHMD